MMKDMTHEGMPGATSSTSTFDSSVLKDTSTDQAQTDPGAKPAGYWTDLAANHRETIASGAQPYRP